MTGSHPNSGEPKGLKYASPGQRPGWRMLRVPSPERAVQIDRILCRLFQDSDRGRYRYPGRCRSSSSNHELLRDEFVVPFVARPQDAHNSDLASQPSYLRSCGSIHVSMNVRMALI